MALSYEIMTPKGPISYWVVGPIQVDAYSRSAYIRLYGFSNAAHAAMDGAEPGQTVETNIYGDDFDRFFSPQELTKNDLYTQAYKCMQSVIYTEGGFEYDFTQSEVI